MKIKRFTTGFTQIPNRVLESDKLSFKAKGVYSYMLSKPDNWDFASERMAEESFGDTKKGVQKALKELLDHGVLKRKRLKSGRIQYELLAKVQATKPYELGAQIDPLSNTVSKEIEKGADTPEPEGSEKDLNKKIVTLISMFKRHNPAAATWYRNNTQRQSLKVLLEDGRYDFETLKIICGVYIPIANTMEPLEYKPRVKKIETPTQLLYAMSTYSNSLEEQEFFDRYAKEIQQGIKELEDYKNLSN